MTTNKKSTSSNEGADDETQSLEQSKKLVEISSEQSTEFLDIPSEQSIKLVENSSDESTEVLEISSEQSTEVIGVSSSEQSTELVVISQEMYGPQSAFLPPSSPEVPSALLARSFTPSPVKDPSMIPIKEMLSSLPGVVEGDEFWNKACSFLSASKHGRELLGSTTVSPMVKEKLLRAEVEKLNK